MVAGKIDNEIAVRISGCSNVESIKHLSDSGNAIIDTTDKMKKFIQITNNLRKINNTEPIPSEFDMIISQRTNIRSAVSL